LGKLEGKVAVITGGNSGIGLATAEAFVAEGDHVYITGRRQERLDAAVARIGRNVIGVQGDVANLADLDRLYAQIERERGCVDVVFANAAIGNQIAPLGSITAEQFKRIVVIRQALRRLFPAIALLLVSASIVNASTINISGSVMGTASTDLAGRCAPFPIVSATGTGLASGLGNFTDTQSHCTNPNFSFNQGMFDLVSTDTPGDSLFGIYSGTASVQGGLLDFTSTLSVTGGTGLFANDSGTLFSVGALNENTGAFSASFSGSVTTVPEPSAIFLIATGIAVLWLTRQRATTKRSRVSIS